MKETPIYKFTLAFIWILFLFANCSYDNTLYNAKKYFKAAQNRPLTQTGKPTPQAVDEYNKTIQKCGYILTERKNSPEADDALFLLAKALFYRGNSPYQAKDQFQSLLSNFPESPYAPEATLYLAKVHRQINESAEAENILTSYIRQPEKAKWHPQALLLLADFSIQDKDNVKAQFWLEKILSQYQKSNYAKEAAFLLGKNLFDNKNYANSLIQFNSVVETRSVTRYVKNDARFYIALNYLMLNEPQKSLKIANNLVKIEDRPEKIPLVRVLIGRALLELKKESEAMELLQNIIKTNSRSLSSAEAYFWMAEYYYYQKNDVQNALDNYNKVKTESATSPYAAEASLKNEALTLITNSSSVKIEDNTQQFVDNQLQIADNYFNVLIQPDSAYVTFDRFFTVPVNLQTRIDSLVILKDSLQVYLDSLSVVADTTKIMFGAVDDSTGTLKDSLQVSLDSLSVVADSTEIKLGTIIDSTGTLLDLDVEVDTLKTVDIETRESQDSLDVKTELTELAVPDSLVVPGFDEIDKLSDTKSVEPNVPDSVGNKLNLARADFDKIQNDIVKLQEAKENFINDYIPYSRFVQAAMIYRKDKESPQLQTIYNILLTDYPQNKYTMATKMMLDDKPVRLIDTNLEKEEELINLAYALIMSNPDSAVVILDELSKSSYPKINTEANFRLGWFFTFEQQDTVKAIPYLNEIAKLDNTDEYNKMLKRFYNGTKYTINFNQNDSLYKEIANPDSLIKLQKVDSLFEETNLDSTDVKEETPIEETDKTETIKPEEAEAYKVNETLPDVLPPERLKFIKPD